MKPENKKQNDFIINTSFASNMSKTKKIILAVFLSGFFVSSFFCFFLDLFMSVTHPEVGHPMTMDRSFINQIIYISVGTTICVGIFGLLNLINIYYKKMPKGIGAKNNGTFMTSMSMFMCIVYAVTIIVGRITGGDTVAGFDNGYKILKSSIEHFLNPVILIILYFTLVTGNVNEKHYARVEGGFIMVFISTGLIFVIVREAVMQSTESDPGTPFPYAEVDPGSAKPYLGIPALILFEFVPYGFENLFNYLSNLSGKSMKKRYPNF